VAGIIDDSHVQDAPALTRARSKEIPVRQPDFSPGRLPPDWLKAIRGAQKRDPPAPADSDESSDRTEVGDSGVYGHSSELRNLVGRLKRERTARGLSLADIARISQQARSAISRLENGQYGNPTLNTLYRYAHALGVYIKLTAEPLSPEEIARDAAADPRRD
jgi:DNA-binding XRE family transcriptional regulator